MAILVGDMLLAFFVGSSLRSTERRREEGIERRYFRAFYLRESRKCLRQHFYLYFFRRIGHGRNRTATMSDRLLITNARIVTQDPANPCAVAMSIFGGRIELLYTAASDMPDVPAAGDELVDCDGATIIPGFADAHCHPLALGAYLSAIDCGPGAERSIPEIIERIRGGAPPRTTAWVRAVGYDELLLDEKRHPTRHDLDRAFASGPVMLTHGGGHAVVLNSLAMSEVRLAAATPEPPGGTIDRDAVTGEPTGLLLEMSDWLAARLPAATRGEQLGRLERAAEVLLAAGVTSVTDAGHRNDGDRVSLYMEAGRTRFPLHTSVMLRPGVDRCEIGSMEGVRPGLTKLMVTVSAGRLHPDSGELRELVEAEAAAGSPGVAIHAVEREAILAAAEALRSIRGMVAKSGFVMRIEHAAEAPPEVVAAIAESGAAVVTQPGFIYTRGDRYLAAATEGGPAPDNLYPLRALIDSGVPIGVGSDAPYGTWRPLEVLRAAVERLAASGRVVGASQAISVGEALGLYGGSLRAGVRADFVVLSGNPLRTEPSRLKEIEVIATYVGGGRVWPGAGGHLP